MITIFICTISTHECTQIKPQSFKQFEVKALQGLKNGAVYEIDYNAKGIPENIIPILDTFNAEGSFELQ